MKVRFKGWCVAFQACLDAIMEGDIAHVRKYFGGDRLRDRLYEDQLSDADQAITCAVSNGQMEILTYLDQTFPDAKPDIQWLVFYATSCENEDIIHWLVARGADIPAADQEYNIMYMLASENATRMMDVWARHGADIELKSGNGYTPLIAATVLGKTAAAEKLISLGADPRTKDRDNKTALDHLEEMYGNLREERKKEYDVLRVLLKQAAARKEKEFSDMLRDGVPTAKEIPSVNPPAFKPKI